MNKVILVGRITKDAEMKVSANGTKICRFTLAINRNYKNSQGNYESDFVNCVSLNKTAETMKNYVKKGDCIGVSGEIRTGSYTDKQGKKVYTSDVMASRISFISKAQRPAQVQQPAPVETKQSDIYTDFSNEIEIDDNFLD